MIPKRCRNGREIHRARVIYFPNLLPPASFKHRFHKVAVCAKYRNYNSNGKPSGPAYDTDPRSDQQGCSQRQNESSGKTLPGLFRGNTLPHPVFANSDPCKICPRIICPEQKKNPIGIPGENSIPSCGRMDASPVLEKAVKGKREKGIAVYITEKKVCDSESNDLSSPL